MEAKLVVVGGDAQVRQYDLHGPTIIGRSRTCDVRLAHPLVSRQHCEVFETNGVLMVRDLGSMHGTFVCDARIVDTAMPLKPGDLLNVGPVTLRAVYQTPQAEQAAAWESSGPTVASPLTGIMDGLNCPPDEP